MSSDNRTYAEDVMQSHPVVIKPLLVQFWRCGKASEGRGWRRCTTPQLCNQSGCAR